MWEEKRNCPAMHEKRGWNTTSWRFWFTTDAWKTRQDTKTCNTFLCSHIQSQIIFMLSCWEYVYLCVFSSVCLETPSDFLPLFTSRYSFFLCLDILSYLYLKRDSIIHSDKNISHDASRFSRCSSYWTWDMECFGWYNENLCPCNRKDDMIFLVLLPHGLVHETMKKSRMSSRRWSRETWVHHKNDNI
jgi:hypothetical protein